MTPAWALRREELLSDCIVSPDVFNPMVDRLGEFVLPYQHALETEAGQRNVHLYLQGLLSHLPGKNAEDIAAFVDVERQVIQEFTRTVSKSPQIVTHASSSEASWRVAAQLDTLAKHAKTVSNRYRITVERAHRTAPERFLRQVALP